MMIVIVLMAQLLRKSYAAIRRHFCIFAAAGFFGVGLAALPALAEDCAFKTPPDIFVGKELMITDLSVVNDSRTKGAVDSWSFGHLMSAMSRDDKRGAGIFVKEWLRSWSAASDFNGFPLSARPAVAEKLIQPWMTLDGAQSFESWVPDLAHAPFRLLAIVYRPDLGIVTKDNAIVNAGEARFVWTAIDPSGESGLDHAPPLPFTLIFEYALPASDRDQVKAWAERWHALGKLPFGSQFNSTLQDITDLFIGPPNANASHIARIRTNEGLDLPWQLREFHLDQERRALVNAPVSNTPHLSLVDQASELSAYINANRGDDIPARFLGGNADMPDRDFRWPRMDISNNVLRHNFAMLTCNGCHAAETGRKADEDNVPNNLHAGFRHISGRSKDSEATLSEFLTGNPAVVTDPTGKLQTFCDLKMREKALFEALHPPPLAATSTSQSDDLSVARSRKDRTD